MIANRWLILLVLVLAVEAGFSQAPETKFKASDAQWEDKFGSAVAVDADVMVISAAVDDDKGSQAGSAYVYEKTDGAWVRTAKIYGTDTDGNDVFGCSAAVDNGRILIGAYNATGVGGTLNTGAAYVFEKVDGVWTQTAKLASSNGVWGDQFGTQVSLGGDVAVIGAPTADRVSDAAGTAYLFELVGDVWTEIGELAPGETLSVNSRFGNAVCVSGGTVAVGSVLDDTTGSDAGSVYIFENVAGVWTKVDKLYGPQPSSCQFGFSLDMEGDTLVVGAKYDSTILAYSGAAYVFTRSAGVWTLTGSLYPTDTVRRERFGHSVSLNGDTICVGCPRDYYYSKCGVAYFFERIDGNWEQIARFNASNQTDQDYFGWSVALQNRYAFVSATYEDTVADASGAVYMYDFFNPQAIAIERYSPTDEYANGSSVVFRTTFNRQVTQVSTANFGVVGTDGQTGATVQSVSSDSGWHIDVTVDTVADAYGNVRLDLSSTAPIVDLTGAPLGAPRSGDHSYLVDRVAPLGTVQINNGDSATDTALVTLALSYSDVGSAVDSIRMSNDGVTWSAWLSAATSVPWTMGSGFGTQTVHVQFRDLAGNITEASDEIELNNHQPTVDLNGTASGIDFEDVFTEGLAATAIATPSATVEEDDASQLNSMTVQIANLLDGASETLTADTSGTSLTSSYDSTMGILTLSGADSCDHYQQVLRTVLYSNSAEDPDTASRDLVVQGFDGTYSALAHCTMAIVPVNDAPVLDANGTTTGSDWQISHTAGGSTPVVDSDATLTDVDDTIAQEVRVTLTNRPDGTAEALAADTTGTSISASYDSGSGLLTLAGPDTLANFLTVLKSVRYTNSAATPDTATRTIDLQAFDGLNAGLVVCTTIQYTFTSGNYFVDLDRPDDTGDGLTWATAKKTIQAGVDAAALDAARREVWVKQGRHVLAHGARVAMMSEVRLLGGYAGTGTTRDINQYETIIDGGGEADSVHVVYFYGTVNCLLEGFTITGGYLSSFSYYGSAVYCENLDSTNRIAHCRISDNWGSRGAGLWLRLATPVVEDCQITDNSVGGIGCFGGGICTANDPGQSAVFRRCVIAGNESEWDGGGIHTGESTLFEDCVIANNESGEDGGGIYVGSSDNDAPIFRNCTIAGNWANFGGGAYVYTSNPQFLNCQFLGNAATTAGGGLYGLCHYQRPVATNCTFAGNFSANYGSAIYMAPVTGGGGPDDFTMPITDCLFANNSGSGYAVYEGGDTASAALSYCTFYGNSIGAYRQRTNSVTIRTYTDAQIAQANTDIAYVNNCYQGNPDFVGNTLYGITGTWKAIDSSQPYRLVLTDPGAFYGRNVVGCVVNPNEGEQPRQGLIVAQTDSTITIIGDMEHYYNLAIGKPYRINDYRLGTASLARDGGGNTSGAGFGSITTDCVGLARGHDGRGDGPTGPPYPGDGSDYDVGAFEYYTIAEPLVDLNGPDAGIHRPYASYGVSGSSFTVAESDATVSDLDSAALQQMKVKIILAQDGANEILTADTSGTAITAAYDTGAHELTLTGPDSLANFQTVLRRVIYRNTAAAPAAGDRVIAFSASDGANDSRAALMTVKVYGAADQPNVQSVLVTGPRAIEVTFTKSMGTSAQSTGNYTLSGAGRGTLGTQPTSITKLADDRYQLNWSAGEMFIGGNITITAANVFSSIGAPLGATNSGTHTGGGMGTAPMVSSLVRYHSTPNRQAVVYFVVKFTEAITGIDASDFVLSTTGTLSGVSITQINSYGTEHYIYVNTGTGEGVLDLDLIDNDTIIDAAGNPLGGVGAGNGSYTTGETYMMDHTPPSVLSVNATPALAKSGMQVDISFSLSEAHYASTNPSVRVNSNSCAFVSKNGVDFVYRYTVGAADATGPAAVQIQIWDLAYNTSETLNTTALVIDNGAPYFNNVAVAPNRLGAGLSATITFRVNEALAANPTVTLGGEAATFQSVNGNQYTYAFTPSAGMADGSKTLLISAQDLIGWIGSNSLPFAMTLDRTAPGVASITRISSNPTKSNSVSFRVTFGETVTGVDGADFILTCTGIAGASISGITGTGPYTVTVITGSGEGTIRLDVTDDDTVRDQAFNPLGGSGVGNGNYSAGEVFTVDKLGPNTCATGPVQPVKQSAANFNLTYVASDGISGISKIFLYCRKAGDASYWQVGEYTASPITVPLSLLSGAGVYEFYTVGLDSMDNLEETPGTPDATVTIQPESAARGWSAYR